MDTSRSHGDLWLWKCPVRIVGEDITHNSTFHQNCSSFYAGLNCKRPTALDSDSYVRQVILNCRHFYLSVANWPRQHIQKGRKHQQGIFRLVLSWVMLSACSSSDGSPKVPLGSIYLYACLFVCALLAEPFDLWPCQGKKCCTEKKMFKFHLFFSQTRQKNATWRWQWALPVKAITSYSFANMNFSQSVLTVTTGQVLSI